MTEAQANWLRTLRDEGPQKPAYPDDTPLIALSKDWARMVVGNSGFCFVITPAGLSALAEYEAAQRP